MFDSDTGETRRFKTKHIEPIKSVEGTTNSGDSSQDGSNSGSDSNQTPFTAATPETDKHKKRKNKRKRNIITIFAIRFFR